MADRCASSRCHADDAAQPVTTAVADLQRREEALRARDRSRATSGLRSAVKDTKRKLLRFLIDAREAGKSVVGYGAPGKGNTLLNYCGIRTDFLDYTVDRSPHKQGRYTPGTHIPILRPRARFAETRPDYVLICRGTCRSEITQQSMSYIREWGGRFVVPIPSVKVLP